MHFGHSDVFFDTGIQSGADFRDVIAEALKAADVALAVIGPHWEAARLSSDEDFVRFELEALLTRGTPVIPVLVKPAGLPSSTDLPTTQLRGLLRRQAQVIDPGADFERDFIKLVRA